MLRLLALAALACALVLGSHAAAEEQSDKGPTIQEKAISHYPYVASAERAVEIRSKSTLVAAAMSVVEVKALLGEPDEIRLLYEPAVKRGKAAGYTYWYVVQRLKENGSVDERREAVVRVSFGFDDRVLRVERWGVD